MSNSKPDLSTSKYRHVFRTSKCSSSEEQQAADSNEYAEFLRSMERKRGRDGFLDSSFYIKKVGDKTAGDSSDDAASPPHSPKPQKSQRLLHLTKSRSQKDDEYRKVVKSIEEGMWQAKQEERHLKRKEGDIVNSQRNIKKTLRDYEQKVAKRRFEQDIKMTQTNVVHDTVQRQFTQQKHEESKERTVEAFSTDHFQRARGRKVQLNGMQLDRQYQAKLDELNLRNAEKTRLAKDFETKMRMKEDEEIKIKRELSQIVSEMKMESIKKQEETDFTEKKTKRKNKEKIDHDIAAEKELETKFEKCSIHAKEAEAKKKRIEAERDSEFQAKALKTREDDRALQTTRMKLSGVAERQLLLNSIAESTARDVEKRKIDQRIEAANKRKRELACAKEQEREETAAQTQEFYMERAQKKIIDVKRRVHEDNLKHFHRSVVHGEDMEHNLYARMKSAEISRQLQEQRVRHLEEELLEVRREDSATVNRSILDAAARERELSQRLSRAKAELLKSHTQREASYSRILDYRNRIADDKMRYQEYSKLHQRLLHIGAKTDRGDSAAGGLGSNDCRHSISV